MLGWVGAEYLVEKSLVFLEIVFRLQVVSFIEHTRSPEHGTVRNVC